MTPSPGSDKQFTGDKSCRQGFNPHNEIDNEKDVQFILALMNPPQAEPPDHRDFPLLRNAIQRGFYIAIFIYPAKMTDTALEVMFEWVSSINKEGKKRAVILPLWAGGANIAGFTQYSLESYCSRFEPCSAC